MALTRTFGAHSAASDRTSPSTAPFAAATEACIGIPWATATVLKSTTLAGPPARPASRGCSACRNRSAPTTLISRSRRSSAAVSARSDLSVIVPGQ